MFKSKFEPNRWLTWFGGKVYVTFCTGGETPNHRNGLLYHGNDGGGISIVRL